MEEMWTIIGLLILAIGTLCGKLTGDHVCQEENRYTVNVTEYFIRNSTIRNYEWCLNVPPRCSFYTTRQINDSRIVEKEVADIVDKCCPGYHEDSGTNTCIPICPECASGTCIQSKCDCFPGYKGKLCDEACDSEKWGKNCQFQCGCENNAHCDPKTGNCTCSPGWTGNLCQFPCPEGFFGDHCRQKCNCQICDHVTGECEVTSTVTTVTMATERTTEEPKKSTRPVDFEIFQFTNNGKFETDKNGFVSTTSVVTETETLITEEDKQQTKTSGTTPAPIITKSLRAKVKAKEVTMTTGHPQEENYLKSDFDLPPVNKNDLVNGASAATAISVAVIIVAVVIVAANHFIRSKKKVEEEKERSKGMPTVSVYAHSIFHTPLPDPPTFENPIFIAPLETSANSEGQRFETRVVCSMNFPAHPSKDSREYLYDHPPSTGSYRAASIPEPPDMTAVTHGGEPLYDEIPSGMIPTPVSPPPPSYKSASLYMNTCGKTRL